MSVTCIRVNSGDKSALGHHLGDGGGLGWGQPTQVVEQVPAGVLFLTPQLQIRVCRPIPRMYPIFFGNVLPLLVSFHSTSSP